MSRPTGRECDEGDCQWLAPKRGVPAATSDRKPTDYQCIGKEHYWPECPRAIRWKLAKAERLGDALCENLDMIADPTDLDSRDALTAWRGRGQS